MTTFPAGFLWGAATSSYQIEGAAFEDGRGLSIWDTFCKEPGKVSKGDNGDIACDHYHLFLDDIALMKRLGLKTYRFSFAWPRLFPQGDAVREERGFAFYDKLINALLAAGIKPLATLYHWDLPQALQDKGGWVNRDIVETFAHYATAIAEHFGDRVKDFSPINEPWVVAWLGYGIGVHAPGHTSRREAFAAAHHTAMSHGAAVNAMRKVRGDLRLGPVLNQANCVPDDANNPMLAHAADVMDAQQNRFWMDAFFHGKYPEILLKEFADDLSAVIQPGDLELANVKNDFLGINFYFDSRIGTPDPTSIKNNDLAALFNLDIDSSPRGPLTDMGWPLTPEGLRNLLVRWSVELGETCPDIYITENGVAYDDGINEFGKIQDDRRIEYLRTHLIAIREAISQGAPVKGYYEWSLMDNFEWAVGYEKRFGIVYVDYETQKRTIKESGHWYSRVIESNGGTL